MSDSDSGGGVPLIEAPKKRKRDDAEKRKAKKARRNKAPADIDEDELDQELGVNKSIATMDGNLMVNYIARRVQKFEKDLSTVELDELRLPGMSILLF